MHAKIFLGQRFFALLLLAATVPGGAYAQADGRGPLPYAENLLETDPLKQMRFFEEVHERNFPGTYHALARFSYNGDFVLLVETDARRTPISDTLLVWVQHYGPEQPTIARQADWADLIITCHPELLSEGHRARHVLPGARGKVWIYFIKGRRLIVSDRRHPVLSVAAMRNP